ncbi:MAG: shikimate dehydrogenase family protein [Culicoidibacterales bacterium]
MSKHFGLLGSGITYSLSPWIHQLIFAELQQQATYELLDWPVYTRAQLSRYSGWNVTIPHKETMLTCIDRLDVHTRAIGAVNTVVCEGNQLVGYNTDWLGFLRSIDASEWQNRHVLLIGAGGAAKAIYYALQQLTDQITISNRTQQNCTFVAPTTMIVSLVEAEATIHTYDYIVQATNQDFTWLQAGRFVYDLRYTTTNCHQNGLQMLIHQAIAAQEYFWAQPITNYQQLAVEIERKITHDLNK